MRRTRRIIIIQIIIVKMITRTIASTITTTGAETELIETKIK
jgi:hypothetical protein